VKITFGKILKKARLEAELTQLQLVELAGKICSDVYVSKVEKSCEPGKRPIRPDIAIVDALAKAAGIPLKVARDSANYATPDLPEINSGGFLVSPKLFSDLGRLESPYREQALSCCEAICEQFIRIQMGYVKTQTPTVAQPVRSGIKRVPLVHPETEKANQIEEARRNRPEMVFAAKQQSENDDDY